MVVSSLLTEAGFESAEKAAVETLTEMLQSCEHPGGDLGQNPVGPLKFLVPCFPDLPLLLLFFVLLCFFCFFFFGMVLTAASDILKLMAEAALHDTFFC